MLRTTIKIGFCPTHRANPLELFSHTEALRYKDLIRNIIAENTVDIVDIDDINPDGLLCEYADVPAVVNKFRLA